MKKYVVVLIVLMSCLCLVSCKKEESQTATEEETTTQKVIMMEDVLARMEEQNWNTIHARLSWSLDREFIDIQADINQLDENRAFINITASFMKGDMKADSAHLTTVLYDNGSFFVNQKEICDYLVAMDEQLIMITGFFKTAKEYVCITTEDIGTLLEENGMGQEKEMLLTYLNQPFGDTYNEFADILIQFHKKKPMFELEEKSACLQADESQLEEAKAVLRELNLENQFLDYIDFGIMKFGVAEKNHLYLQCECENQAAGEKMSADINFTNETNVEMVFPEEYTSFAEVIKIYNRIQKMFGMLS